MFVGTWRQGIGVEFAVRAGIGWQRFQGQSRYALVSRSRGSRLRVRKSRRTSATRVCDFRTAVPSQLLPRIAVMAPRASCARH